LLAVILLILSSPLFAADKKILLLMSGNSSVYTQVVSSLKQQLLFKCSKSVDECMPPQITLERLSDKNGKTAVPDRWSKWDLIVTIGLKAALYIKNQKIDNPVLYTLIPRSAEGRPGLGESAGKRSAIYLDQPIRRQLQVIQLIHPRPSSVSILLGPSTADLKHSIDLVANQLGLKVHWASVESSDAVGAAQKRILLRNSILLALPDPVIYNRKTIFNILLSSYHSKVPVIGFSAAYVKAGAMLAIYSTPDDIGRHLGETIERFLRHHHLLPPPEYPRYFHVEINRQVADSLDFTLPSAEKIRSYLSSREGY